MGSSGEVGLEGAEPGGEDLTLASGGSAEGSRLTESVWKSRADLQVLHRSTSVCVCV